MNPLDLLLAPLRTVNRLRRWLYRRGILRSKRLSAPVVSVGNLAMGGAGKTPAVIAIARHLATKRVVILTRGYGRSGEGGEVTSLDAARYGDEPVLMKTHAPNARVIVGSNRHENGSKIDADIYVLDDGFQHLQLARDLDVVIDGPAKLHREGRSALRDADVVLKRNLQVFVPPIRRAFAFAGLANNEQFFATLRKEGVALAGTLSFADHHRYTASDLERIRKAANGLPILTTEKDAVKLPPSDDIIAVRAEFVLPPEVLAKIDALLR
ncbi:MAG: tetraacyldisaccharide 4'-kinase [Acidobacteria bacterium]|nr:tetraacyldisaccharide 4'-kinase [Acidobacteriota bacterium]